MLGATSKASSLVGRVGSSLASTSVLLTPSAYDPASSTFDSSAASVVKLPASSSDPCDALLRIARETEKGTGFDRPIALFASATPSVLSSLVSSLYKSILGFPIVLHLATNGDHASLQVLKSSGYVLLYSASADEAQKNALLASKIAVSASRAVVHFFEAEETGSEVALPFAAKFLEAGKKLNGHVNGMANGHGQTTGNPDEDNLPSRHHSLQSAIDEAYELAEQHKLNLRPVHYAGPSSPSRFVIALGTSTSLSHIASSLDTNDVGILSVSLYRPMSPATLLSYVPESVRHLVVLEQAYTKATKWAPLYLDVLSAFHSQQENPRTAPVISSATLGAVGTATAPSAAKLIEELFSNASTDAVVGQLPSNLSYPSASPSVPKHELAYHKVLAQAFQDRLQVLNDLESPSPALAVGKQLAHGSNPDKASWIIGSDAWSYDTGLSGIQTLLSTGIDCNILIVDTSPYPAPKTVQRKKDIGLFALNYGNAYVASVAVYGDYSQTVRALVEAEKFQGPSVVMAYLPGGEDDTVQALDVLKSTKRAMESGFWGLYRYDPSKSDADAFTLDSVKIKQDLADFLDRQNLLTQLASRLPSYDINTVSLGEKAKEAQQTKAKQAFDRLSSALSSGPGLLLLYASDGGVCEKLAKKFVARANSRGVNARAVVMDEFAGDLNSLKEQKEDNVVFMTSTAGQGEFPLNGRSLWKALQAVHGGGENAPDGGDGAWSMIKYAVFGLGDSHYWPRPEDAGYYNKPAKDLDRKLGTELAIPRLVEELGLGDDQDSDGYMTGYKVWEEKVWQALGVAGVEIVEAEPEPITNEHIKIASNYLRGTIAEGLRDTSTGALAESDGQLTKFHGIYQQDDRDIREERTSQGMEPAYSFMVRVRMPAGVCTAEQWQAIDNISDTRGNGTFKLTTRQTFQFHGIIKADLKPAIQMINKAMLDTIAACGDVNRNVMCSCNPSLGPIHAQISEFAKNISEHLMPRTNAYAEIWLDKKLVAGDAVKDVEPMYGPYYLPRKFKIAIAVPPTNDTDVFCHDVGFIAIVSPEGTLQGFNVTIGGGMGVTHSMKKTYPRLGTVIGFITPEQGCAVAEKIMLVQRDHGDRTNRKHARLKYTVDDMSVEGFKKAVEDRLGYKLAPERAYKFERNVDQFGWQTGWDGKKHFTCFIENGRVEDTPTKQFKTGLREVAKAHKGVFRCVSRLFKRGFG